MDSKIFNALSSLTWRKNVLAPNQDVQTNLFLFLVCKLPRDIHKNFEHNPHPNNVLPKEDVCGFGHVVDAPQDVARAMKAAM